VFIRGVVSQQSRRCRCLEWAGQLGQFRQIVDQAIEISEHFEASKVYEAEAMAALEEDDRPLAIEKVLAAKKVRNLLSESSHMRKPGWLR
jgi:hypothetical protein